MNNSFLLLLMAFNKIFKFGFIVIFLLCIALENINASETDTLLRRSEIIKYNGSQSDTEKVKLGFSIIESFIHQDNYEAAQDWINKLFILNETYHTPDFDYLVNSYQCEIFYYGSLQFLALSYAKQGLQIAITNKDSFSIADAFGFMSYIYEEMDSVELAKKHSLLAFNAYPKLQKQHAEKYITQGQIVNQLSQLLVKLNLFDSAYLYNSKAYTLALMEKSERAQIMCLATMGNIFYGKKQLDSAAYYYNCAYTLALETNRPDLQLHILGRLVLLSKSTTALDEVANKGFVLMKSTEINSLYVSLFMKDVRFAYITCGNTDKVRAIDIEIQEIENKKQLSNFRISETLSKKFIEKQQQLLQLNKQQRGKDKTIFLYNMLGIASILGLTVFVVYNNQSRKKRALNKLLLQEKALQEERNLIASNMHDDLGGVLSRMQYVLHDFNATLVNDEQEQAGKRITGLYEESVEYMNEMIWCLKPEYNNINDLQIYCRGYFQNWCERNDIESIVVLELLDNNMPLTTTFRRTLFLIMKDIIASLNQQRANPKYRLQFSFKNANKLYIIINDLNKMVDVKKCLTTSNIFKLNKLAREIHLDIVFVTSYSMQLEVTIT
jgi:signal transduction histidine kinase